jgi:hypothetical protein
MKPRTIAIIADKMYCSFITQDITWVSNRITNIVKGMKKLLNNYWKSRLPKRKVNLFA